MAGSSDRLEDQTYVSLDLETTGLSADNDDIIEIGAVKFRGPEVLGTFSSLVNPNRPLSTFIQELTGITPRDLERAPIFAAVAGELAEFAGHHPVVGHNIGFDLEFLRKKGLRVPGPGYDTFDLASILFPSLSEYSLSGVSRSLGIAVDRPHRAVYDARMAMGAFLKLLEALQKIEPALLAEMSRIASRSDWPLKHLIRQAAGVAAAPALNASEPGFEGVDLRALGERLKAASPLTRTGERRPVEPEAVDAILRDGGPLATTLGAFETRPEQSQMAEAVARAFSEPHHLIVEAGTGTGKSLAYLLPGALYALRNGERVVVSTNTINLQEQIIGKDIPAAVAALRAGGALPAEEDLHFSLLKGRANYLCLRRWSALKSSDSLTPYEARTVIKVLLWLQSTATGDRGEINLAQQEQGIWNRLSAQGGDDRLGPCPLVRRGLCPYNAARQRAEAAHVVVVNHALLALDASMGSLLPDYSHLIVDEAHHLEEAATNQWGFQVDDGAIDQFLSSIAGGATTGPGLLTPFRALLRNVQVAESRRKDLGALLDETDAAIQAVRSKLNALFKLLSSFAQKHTRGGAEYDARVQLTPSARAQPGWSQVEIAWEDANTLLEKVHRNLERLYTTAEQLSGFMARKREDLLSELLAVAEAGAELRKALASAVAEPETANVYWISIGNQDGTVRLHSAPLRVGPLLKERLFDRKDTVVLTGATLSTEGHFEYVKDRLSLEPASEVLLGSPFDYRRLALMYIPKDVPEPSDPGYQAFLERTVADVARAAHGRTMVLFTSRSSMKATRNGLHDNLAREGITVLAQGIDGSARHLVNIFKTTPNMVLLGTGSFWEGVDIAGEALSVLVIARIPFTVPTDPVFAARSQQFEDPFSHYAVPQAVIRFRQGFGRLIRRKTDRGVLVVLDRRIFSRGYGAAFLDSIPKCAVRSGPAAQLPSETVRWLTQGRLG